ncbi:hypothetical protein TruAng_011106 [Truncatella angustata]|nr:hypothetical protein TruAng_011106 [Truncatella angustata]
METGTVVAPLAAMAYSGWGRCRTTKKTWATTPRSPLADITPADRQRERDCGVTGRHTYRRRGWRRPHAAAAAIGLRLYVPAGTAGHWPRRSAAHSPVTSSRMDKESVIAVLRYTADEIPPMKIPPVPQLQVSTATGRTSWRQRRYHKCPGAIDSVEWKTGTNAKAKGHILVAINGTLAMTLRSPPAKVFFADGQRERDRGATARNPS